MFAKIRQGASWLLSRVGEEEIFIPENMTEEQLQMGQTVKDFVDKEVWPNNEKIEHKEPGVSDGLLRKAGEIGLLMAEIPEAYGGLGLGKVASTIMSEQATTQGSWTVSYMCHTGIGTLPILYFGTEEQKRKYLPKLATGEYIGAYALTEAGSGSDALAAKTKAVLSPDGKHYILNGEKMFITNGSWADVITVFAKVDGEHFTGFIVEKGYEGVSAGKEEKKMGIHGSSTVPIILQDAKVPVENVLGEIGKGHKIAFNVLNVGRWKLGAACTGGCKRVLEHTVRYVKERKQFGQPLADFEIIQQKIADSVIRTYVTESIMYRYAGELDAAIATLDKSDAEYDKKALQMVEEYAIEASICKVYGSEAMDFVADEGVQMHGGYGYIEEYPVEAFYRNSRINRIFEGTNEINRMIIPGTLLKRAMKGEIDLMGEIQRILGQLKEGFPKETDQRVLVNRINLVNQAKKLAVYVSGVAVQKYMGEIKDRQSFMIAMADFIIEVYAMESALLRSLQLIKQVGEEKARIPIAITKSYVTEKCLELVTLAKQFCANVAKGDDAAYEKYAKAIDRILEVKPLNTLDLKLQIAQHALEKDGYAI
ncbi:MAG TPA: acyl-CoA dehydrogenase family protein [bacterium]|nr:acyl-CoA dehydrogenase family protein [bacterium]